MNLGTWKSRNLEIICGLGNPEIWGPKNGKIKILKIQIRSAQNVGKVWISRKKSSWPYLGPSEAIFFIAQKNQKIMKKCLFSLVGQWALFTRFGPLLLSTRGGERGLGSLLWSLWFGILDLGSLAWDLWHVIPVL